MTPANYRLALMLAIQAAHAAGFIHTTAALSAMLREELANQP
jgi:hypothetical protein